MKITSTVTTPALANAWTRLGQVDEDGRGFQDDGDWLLTRGTQGVGLLNLADDVLQSFLHLLHGAAPAGPPKICDPVVDVQFVPRQFVPKR
jgi:hypothetical protein